MPWACCRQRVHRCCCDSFLESARSHHLLPGRLYAKRASGLHEHLWEIRKSCHSLTSWRCRHTGIGPEVSMRARCYYRHREQRGARSFASHQVAFISSCSEPTGLSARSLKSSGMFRSDFGMDSIELPTTGYHLISLDPTRRSRVRSSCRCRKWIVADQRLVADVWRCEMIENAVDGCRTESSRPMHPMILEVALCRHEPKTPGRIECWRRSIGISQP